MTRNQALKRITELGFGWRKAGRSAIELIDGPGIVPNLWIGPNAWPKFSSAQEAMQAIEDYYCHNC